MIVVADLTWKLAAFTEPNLTALTPLKPVPVIVTVVPPVAGPLGGFILLTVGGGTTCVVHDFVVSCPTLSIAVRVTVTGPAFEVSIGTVRRRIDAAAGTAVREGPIAVGGE